MIIRKETPKDYETIYTVVKAAFDSADEADGNEQDLVNELRMGYLPADTFDIQPPFDVPRENFMAIKLKDNAPVIHGVLHYAKEFGMV